MAESRVSYNTDGINTLAAQLHESVETFKKEKVNKFFDTMADEIGYDETHKTWNGDLARDFMDITVNPKKQEFEAACNNIISYADNLASQAKSWSSFEDGQ